MTCASFLFVVSICLMVFPFIDISIHVVPALIKHIFQDGFDRIAIVLIFIFSSFYLGLGLLIALVLWRYSNNV